MIHSLKKFIEHNVFIHKDSLFVKLAVAKYNKYTIFWALGPKKAKKNWNLKGG